MGLDSVLEHAVAIATEAGDLTLEHFRSDLTIDAKADGSEVTVADRGAELLVRDRLAASFADDAIVGEEFDETKLRSAAAPDRVGWLRGRFEIPTPEVVVNLAKGLEEGRAIARKLRLVCERFLSRSPRQAGWLPRSREIAGAAGERRPFVVSRPQGLGALCIGQEKAGVKATHAPGGRDGARHVIQAIQRGDIAPGEEFTPVGTARAQGLVAGMAQQ